jgi:beta-glucuronidase
MKLSRRSLIGAGAAAPLIAPAAAAAIGPDVLQRVANQITAPSRRSRITLDGEWRYLLDPFDVSGRKPGARRNFWEDRPTSDDGPLVEYEWASSPTIQVPGDWNTADPELFHYEGPAYFQRDVEGPPPDGRRRFLLFEAVNYRARVWLNGEEIARHEGGFTPFEVEVTGRLLPDRNSLVVRADSRHDARTLPALDFDWKNHGGITRSVWLIDVPATFVQDAFVRLERSLVVADIVLNGQSAPGTAVRLRIPSADVDLRGVADASGRVQLSTPLPRRLTLWSPETPELHEVEIVAGQDRLTDRIGFRTLEARGTEILLNGRPRFLKGIALHEEPIGPDGGRHVDADAARALLAEAKALGCDFVRLAHYPHGETTLRLADEMGLMVWAEVPIYWEDVAYDSPETLTLACAMTAELVRRDRNRCAVAFWSVANETPQTEARLIFLRQVIDVVRQLDATRLVTAALNKNVDVGGVRDGEARLVVQDALGADLDVIAMNQYEGWYGARKPDRIRDVTFGSTWDKPLIMSEFGADALAGHRGDRTERWTEDHQAWIFDETLKAIARSGRFAGVSPWLLKDFRSPRRWHGRFQNGWNRKGVIAPDGTRKQAFETLRRFYGGTD